VLHLFGYKATRQCKAVRVMVRRNEKRSFLKLVPAYGKALLINIINSIDLLAA